MTMNKTLLVFIALSTGMYSRAQDSTNSKSLDPVVVTARKYPVKLSETGKMISLISRQQVEQSQGKSLAQLLTEQSGIIVNGAYSNPGKDKSLFLSGASNDYTLILLDGVPVNDPSGPGGAFDLRLFPIDQIDHIEIMKGSQSTLYGSDAMAGVINIITKKGGEKKIGFSGSANYGSFNSLDASAGINGSLKALDYNVGYSYASTDGISEAFDTTKSGDFDKDGLIRNSFQANLGFKAGSKIKISPYYRYSYYSGGFDADAFTDGNNHFTAILNNTGVNSTIALPNGTITANYGYTYAKRLYESSFGATPFRGSFNNAEVYLTQKLHDRFSFLAGLSYQTYRLHDTTLEQKNPYTTITSPYLSVFILPADGLNLELGGRYNHHSKFGSNFTYSFNSSYQAGKSVKLFGNVSTGFKAPAVSDLLGPTAYGSNPDLKPEKSFSAEAGVNLLILKTKLQLNASVYSRNITDLIAYVGTRLINIDEQKDRGFELEATYRPDDRWTLKAAYNYVTGNLHQSRAGKDTSFFNLLRRPESSITANLGFQATPKLFLNVSLLSLGKRTDMFFAPPTYMGKEVKLDAYMLLNAYAEYKLLKDKFAVFVNAKNITDADFTEVYGYSTTGINASAGFRFKF
jgi:vitamin B12 transporter